jgi:hypothetical protein
MLHTDKVFNSLFKYFIRCIKKTEQRHLHFFKACDPQQKADPSLILAYI